MKDTSEAMAVRFQKMIMKRNPEERLLMGCSMFDAAREIVKSAIMEQHPGISPEKMTEEVFLRFYGPEFSESEKRKILSTLKSVD